MTAETELQWRFVFPEKNCFFLLTGTLLIPEKLDLKIKIPRKCHVLPCSDISEFSYIFEVLHNTIQGTKSEPCPKYSTFPSF